MGWERTYDEIAVSEAVAELGKPVIGFVPKEWLSDTANIALINQYGDVCLFEASDQIGLYTGHWFFYSRGKTALEEAKKVGDKIFNQLDFKVLRGLTPLYQLGARWLARKVGFTSYGVVHTSVDICELFILTKEEWNKKYE